MREVDPSGAVSSAELLALAARVEAEGRYNVAKLLRAAVLARAQRAADEALAAPPRGEALLEALAAVADAFAADPLLAPLSAPLREGTRAFAAGGVPLIDAVPAEAWWRTGRHREFGRLSLTQQVSYFAAHEPTHLRQLRAAARG